MPDAGTSGVGGRVWTQGSASAFDRHAVNPANQITQLAGDYSTNGVPGGGSGGGLGGPGVSPVNVIHDPAGNMVFDVERYYQYDAVNHLLSVHWLGGASLSVTTGQIVDGELGELIARYAYDGLGRLIARYAPDGSSTSSSGTDSRAEHYYYDGVRRISEVRVAGLSDCRLEDCDWAHRVGPPAGLFDQPLKTIGRPHAAPVAFG